MIKKKINYIKPPKIDTVGFSDTQYRKNGRKQSV